ncbi:MAG: alkaline phosphatase, partial [Acidobacteria bacterium]|nr:alkaline phosphatase [Acidobacteriota bacterium]
MRITFTAFAVLVMLVVPIPGVSSEPPAAHAQSDPVIAAAGDIACDPAAADFDAPPGTGANCRAMETSDLLLGAGLAAVLPLGDLQYDCANSGLINASYDMSWGRVKSITRPAIGNHEYKTSTNPLCDGNATDYFDYFGAAAGNPAEAWYSYDIGSWHLIALNSNCSDAGGCGPGSPQEQWLRADLAANPAPCTLAYWHHARWSSGLGHGSDPQTGGLIKALYE